MKNNCASKIKKIEELINTDLRRELFGMINLTSYRVYDHPESGISIEEEDGYKKVCLDNKILGYTSEDLMNERKIVTIISEWITKKALYKANQILSDILKAGEGDEEIMLLFSSEKLLSESASFDEIENFLAKLFKGVRKIYMEG